MYRHLAAFLGALLFAGTAGAAGKDVTIRWHGQSFFEITSSLGTRVVIDPHGIDAYGRISVRADLVLITHRHTDHTQVDVVENYNKVKIIQGLKENGRRLDWNLFDEKFRDVHIRSLGFYHDNAQGMERGKTAAFVLEVDGLRIAHLGDLGHQLSEAQVKEIGPVDVLMVPIGGVYTLNGSEAQEVVARIKPKKYIIPMHYGTKVYDELLPPDEFLDGQNKANIRRLPTNKLTVNTDFKPAEPVIALLNYE